ncbi:MAG TPA: PAS domain-containing protein [Thermotogota bacterium]|nr:PAS domain-containing protein [Thermotogota bacterium]
MREISFQSMINTLDLFSTGVAIVDQEGRFLFWNSGASLITGHTAQKIVGKTFDEAMTMIDVFGVLLRDALSTWKCGLARGVDRDSGRLINPYETV